MCSAAKVALAFVLVTDTYKQYSEPIKTQSNYISLTHSARPYASHGPMRTDDVDDDDDDTKHRKTCKNKLQLVLFSILVVKVF